MVRLTAGKASKNGVPCQGFFHAARRGHVGCGGGGRCARIGRMEGKPDIPNEAIVLGVGASGCAAARALLRRGARVALVAPPLPPGPHATAGEPEALEALGAELLRMPAAAAVAGWAPRHAGAAAVFSPGIAPSSPEAAAARAVGLRLFGELDLGAALWRGRLVCVTGSKGKSSLVKLLADALRAAGHTAEPCGNYGLPLCALADREAPPDFAVCECSSFQLEWARGALAPEVAILLNVSQDHLDRHGSIEAYRDAKLSLFAGQGRGAFALLPAAGSEGALARYAALFPDRPPLQTFGAEEAAQWRWTRGGVSHPATGREWRTAGSYFDNDVLGPAAAAAVAALDALGLAREQIEAALRAFEPLPHRMRTIGSRGGVAWIDNSKATSLAALEASVRMAPKPVFLLAGGRLKEPVSLPPNKLVEIGVEKVYTFGECAPLLQRVWSTGLPAEPCETLERAVAAAARDTAGLPAGSVLLAPGTASFDQFRSFEHRGERFAELFRNLPTT